MSKPKRAMGRGLSAILNSESKQVQSATDSGAKQIIGNIVELPISDIFPNPTQPRTHFDETALNQLAQSIKELGIIQPITVRKVDSNYEIISGERRFRASQLAGLTKIPAFIRIANDQELLEMALVENIQREDLDAIEVALTYQRLIEEINLTQEELSKRVGKERSTITNYIRLLKLIPAVQTAIRDAEISMGHGRAMLSLDSDVQLAILSDIIKDKLSVRETEKRILALKNTNEKKPQIQLPEHITTEKKQFEDFFNAKVNLKINSKGKGSISLNFNNQEELRKILQRINN
ncbi:MAG: ParB/RepB/Spo0J family partition protein [Flavobacteriales bacterium]|nr:ParB/RepB/Spo0J family partition protein [Flavobacteriales bacterium]